jgi:hypothetical protein
MASPSPYKARNTNNSFVQSESAKSAIKSLNQRSISRTLLRSTGKYAMTNPSSSKTSTVDMKAFFSGTQDLRKQNPGKDVSVITLDELEMLRLRAARMDDRVMDIM